MDFVSPILYVATRLWDCTAKHSAYVSDLEENLNSLREARDELNNISADVKRRVEREEQKNYQRTNQVNGWLQRVEVQLNEVSEILQKGDQEIQEKCLGRFCPKNCRSSYKLGKMVTKKLNDVKNLKNEGQRFDVVADKLPSEPVDEIPMEKPVGLKLTFEKLWRCLEEERTVGTIGIYGQGGVGKTTLLKKINNAFLSSSHNFVVIWVVVSKEAKVEKIQQLIGNKLEIANNDAWKNRSNQEKAIEIFSVLKRKPFVLLLDDIWERVDLINIGVPPCDDRNESKVIFTTRSEELCDNMQARRKFIVECLPRKDALDLFQKSVGEDTLYSHPDIPKLSETVAEGCKGLPLALVTIGLSMAGKTKSEEWKRVIKMLQTSPSRLSSMKEEVFDILKTSYDFLKDDTLKKCFLYCSIFPEDYNFRKEELIQLWFGEGFLDEFDDVNDAWNEGEFGIIKSLKRTCLLENGELELENADVKKLIKMHDVIRDMALWIAREFDKKKNKILIGENDDGLIKAQEFGKWNEAERISLWGRSIKCLPKPVTCSYLQTLIIRDTELETFPSEFFQNMPALKVLDLSNNSWLEVLPVSIGDLINLCYLNLSNTGIREMCSEIEKLTKLRILLLNDFDPPIVIPKNVISSLLSLQVFSSWGGDSKIDVESELLQQLECLENIRDIRVTLSACSSVQKILLASTKLQSCLRMLRILMCSGLTLLNISSSSLRRLENLESLEIVYCHELKELRIDKERQLHECFRNLKKVVIVECPILEDVTWLTYAPTLQSLTLISCESMEEVIREDFGTVEIEENLKIFSKLRYLSLMGLEELKSICERALPFPSLRQMVVIECSKLRKLPFDSNSAKNSLKEIRGAREWWEDLQWEDEATKHAFDSKFKKGG